MIDVDIITGSKEVEAIKGSGCGDIINRIVDEFRFRTHHVYGSGKIDRVGRIGSCTPTVNLIADDFQVTPGCGLYSVKGANTSPNGAIDIVA